MPDEYKNRIVTGDARELAKRIPDESVDLVFTDPPYPKEYLYLYDWLGEIAARVLKPTGFLLTYLGVYWKQEVMKRLSQSMDYYFDFVLENAGKSPIMWQRKVISRHKSIMAWTRKDTDPKPYTNILSLWRGGGEDKRYHTWGQDESSARYYIDCFSRQDHIVADFMVGGGTTAAVCKILHRNYIAFEIDKDTAEIAQARLETTQPYLFMPQPEQLELVEKPQTSPTHPEPCKKL